MKLNFRKNLKGNLEADLPVEELCSDKAFLDALSKVLPKDDTYIMLEKIIARIERKTNERIAYVYFVLGTWIFSMILVGGFFEMLRNIH